MPKVSIDLPQHAYDKLCFEAVRHRRPVPGEAEIRLLRSLRVPLMPGRPTQRPESHRPADARELVTVGAGGDDPRAA